MLHVVRGPQEHETSLARGGSARRAQGRRRCSRPLPCPFLREACHRLEHGTKGSLDDWPALSRLCTRGIHHDDTAAALGRPARDTPDNRPSQFAPRVPRAASASRGMCACADGGKDCSMLAAIRSDRIGRGERRGRPRPRRSWAAQRRPRRSWAAQRRRRVGLRHRSGRPSSPTHLPNSTRSR